MESTTSAQNESKDFGSWRRYQLSDEVPDVLTYKWRLSDNPRFLRDLEYLKRVDKRLEEVKRMEEEGPTDRSGSVWVLKDERDAIRDYLDTNRYKILSDFDERSGTATPTYASADVRLILAYAEIKDATIVDPTSNNATNVPSSTPEKDVSLKLICDLETDSEHRCPLVRKDMRFRISQVTNADRNSYVATLLEETDARPTPGYKKWLRRTEYTAMGWENDWQSKDLLDNPFETSEPGIRTDWEIYDMWSCTPITRG
ncbi:hypothetical protein IAR55_000725 [Kwoniella newhampshirensis]|uniref:Uncharacterized protein n=1 Tax=Kwoniella newhampshirensis TaxID=1651941 RepID=A0AAW0Z411_9TREE